LVYGVIGLSGCSAGRPPTAELAQATLAVQEADKSKAPQYAPAELHTARQELESAQQALREKDYTKVRRDADPVRLGDTLPLPYAQGLAEDYARHLGVARLVEAEAPWRQHPATEKQTALLRKLGIAARPGWTRGEAADVLSAVLGDWD